MKDIPNNTPKIAIHVCYIEYTRSLSQFHRKTVDTVLCESRF